jgi:uncharacterized small protein (TIGR04563 family)
MAVTTEQARAQIQQNSSPTEDVGYAVSPDGTQLVRVKNDKRKQSLYFPEYILAEIKAEAARQDRSLSWIVQRAWKMARAQMAELPGSDPIDS